MFQTPTQMLSRRLFFSICLACLPVLFANLEGRPPTVKPIVDMQWSQLPSLPDPEGFASSFAGTSGGALLVAGGANFPERRPWEGGRKVWYDRVYALEGAGSSWKLAGALPRPTAYGVSADCSQGVICAGGGDAQGHFRDVFLLRWVSGRLEIEALPRLPKACAFGSGAVVVGRFYLAGGIETPTSTEALAALWELDLNDPRSGWRVLPPCPGAPRMLAVAAGAGACFYYIGGVSLRADASGKALRTYLNDAYRYRPGEGWTRLSDLPRPVAAAASPAPVTQDGLILICSGDDGSRVPLTGPSHPGFDRSVFIFDPSRQTWSLAGEIPFSRATVPTACWLGRWVFASGERIPGCRSPEVWSLSLSDSRP